MKRKMVSPFLGRFVGAVLVYLIGKLHHDCYLRPLRLSHRTPILVSQCRRVIIAGAAVPLARGTHPGDLDPSRFPSGLCELWYFEY
jgi:hypothetical protein